MWYIHYTYTISSSWHDLQIPHGGLCHWPTFHAWLTMVRKKLLSLYYSTHWCYIYQTCTCSSWHDLLMPRYCWCSWLTFHVWVTLVRKNWLREKGKEEIWLSPVTKTPTPTEQSKKQRDNIKTPPKTLITQLLRTDLGRSVGVTAVTQLVWLNRFTSAQPSY